MYIDQRRGAPHVVCWLKSFVSALKQVFLYFSITHRKKEKRKESTKITQKNMLKNGVHQRIGVTKKTHIPSYGPVNKKQGSVSTVSLLLKNMRQMYSLFNTTI